MSTETPGGEAPESESFGRWLQRAREAKKLSLEDLAYQTKIRRAIVEALEANARRELPEKVFVLGYVRSYATAVGLPVEDAARRFLASWGDDEVATGAEEVVKKGLSLAFLPPALALAFAAGVVWIIVHLN